MLISNRFRIPFDAGEVFRRLIDVDCVIGCLPGATLAPPDEGPERKGAIEVRFGMLRLRYAGAFRFVDIDAINRCAVIAGAGDGGPGQGTASATARIQVESERGGALVYVATQLQVTGAVAQFSHGMIEDIAQEIIEDFGRRLTTLMTGERAGASSSIVAPGNASPDVPTLRGGALLVGLVRRRLSRLFKRRRRRSPRTAGRLDFAIVGTGSGGLTAAIALHDAGLKVAIFEKAAVVGGGTAYSGGVIWAPCNQMMQRKGIEDHVEEAMRYLTAASAGRGDETLQRTYVENVGAVIEQVRKWTGIDWIIWPGQPDYYPDLPGACLGGRAILQHPNAAAGVLEPAEADMPELALVRLTPHMDYVPGFQTGERPARESWLAGRAIIGGLWKAVVERDIEYHLSTPVTDLIANGKHVVGLRVREPDGRARQIATAHGVLLNTGGFDWNRKLARSNLPGPLLYPQTPPSNTGDGHRMAVDLGAATALMDKAVFHPAIHIPGEEHDGAPLYRMFNAEMSKPHSILINRSGRRFASEASYFAVCEAFNAIDPRLRTFDNVPSYLVMEARYRDKYGLPTLLGDAELPPHIFCGDTLEELAAAIHVDVAGLATEVALYNADCATGIDSRFGRGSSAYERYWGDPDQQPNPTMGPIEQGPFYAIQIYPSHAGTRGGVLISPVGEVIDAGGQAIRGLFACGNTAANLLFGAGYGSGSAVGSSMVFGYLAAQEVVRRSAIVAAAGMCAPNSGG